MKARIGTILDYSGIALSWACMVHCVLLPFAIPLLPALEIFADDHTHKYLAVVILLVGAFAFHRGYQKHQNTSLLLLGLAGIGLLFIALTLPIDSVLSGGSHSGHNHSGHSHSASQMQFLSGEALVTILGSVILVYAHLHNIRLSRRSCCGGSHGEKTCPIEHQADNEVGDNRELEKKNGAAFKRLAADN